MKKQCPVCKKMVDALSSAARNNQYISERCAKCLAVAKDYSLFSRKYERDRQREDYRKDIIQRYEGDKINPDFVNAYPEKAAQQWGDSVLRDNGVNRKQF